MGGGPGSRSGPGSSAHLCAAFQIDPSVLQQTLQHSSLLAQPLAGEAGGAPHGSSLPAADGAGPASVVIQPIAGLSLQPTVTSANLTISPVAEDSVLTTSSGGKGPPGAWDSGGVGFLLGVTRRVWDAGACPLSIELPSAVTRSPRACARTAALRDAAALSVGFLSPGARSPSQRKASRAPGSSSRLSLFEISATEIFIFNGKMRTLCFKPSFALFRIDDQGLKSSLK